MMPRVSPTYVIATSTTVDVSKVDVKKFTDKYFGCAAKTSEEEFFAGDDATKATVSKVDVKKFTDKYFGRAAKTSEEEFFAGDDATKATVSDERKADQKTVDAKLMKAVESV